MNRKIFIAMAALGLAASASAYAGQATSTTVTAMQEPAIRAPVGVSAPRTPAKVHTWNNVVIARGVGDCGLACRHGASTAK
jgi:hypothetical protein